MSVPTRAQRLLQRYYEATWDDERGELAKRLLALAQAGLDPSALEALTYVLNDERSSDIRLGIVTYLHEQKAPAAIPALTKVLFDGDPRIRARAAMALSEYRDAKLLAPSLLALLDAVTDPATRTPSEQVIRAITGRSSDKISVSERERLRLGDSPESIWPDQFMRLLAPPTDSTENTPSAP